MVNMTVYNVTDMITLWQLGDTLTDNLMSPVILFVVFFAVLIALKNSKLAISGASLVTLILALILQSLGFVNEGVVLLLLTALAVSALFAIVKG